MIEIHATGSLTYAGTTTPIRLHLRGYFSKLLQKKREKPVKAGDKCKAKPQFYGEALTLDEVKERYEQALAEKHQKQKGTGTKVAKKKASNGRGKQNTKSKKKQVQQNARDNDGAADHSDNDEEICQGCQKKYDTDNEAEKSTWVGCDNCWRWYHFPCAGLSVLPAEEDYWSCPQCK